MLKGIIEGAAFYLKEVVDSLPETGIQIKDYRAVGGGSQSDAWVQTCADIFGQPITRPAITEAGALGAAIVAGVGSGMFGSYEEGVRAMVKLERTFEPDERRYQILPASVSTIPAVVAADGEIICGICMRMLGHRHLEMPGRR